MLRVLAIALAMTATATAHAATDWSRVDSRAETTYKIANWGILGGITASLVGGLANQKPMAAAGNLVFTGSMATTAGATLRQRRSIVERGVPTTAAWGYSSWGLQAATIGLGVGSQVYLKQKGYSSPDAEIAQEDVGVVIGLGLGSLACSIGAILTASKQHRENAYKRSLIGRSAAPSRSVYVSVQPTVGTRGEPGLAAVGLF